MFTTTASKSTTRKPVTRSRSNRFDVGSDVDDDAAASLRSPTRHRTRRVVADLTTTTSNTEREAINVDSSVQYTPDTQSNSEMTQVIDSTPQQYMRESTTLLPPPSITGASSIGDSAALGRTTMRNAAGLSTIYHDDDIDHAEDISLATEVKLQKYLLKSDQCSISVLSALPLKVKEFLNVADWNSDSFRVIIDSQSEYAALVALKQCYVWSYRQTNGSAPPTCIGFTLPTRQTSDDPLYKGGDDEMEGEMEEIFTDDASSTSMSGKTLPSVNAKRIAMSRRLPVVCFVPNGAQREPGLLCCSAYGHVRYWERVSYGIAGVDRNQQLRMHLSNRDWIVDMQSCRPSGFVVSTAQGDLFKLSLWNASGKVALSFAPLSRSMNMLARMGRRLKDMVTGNPELTQELVQSPVSVVAPGTRDDKYGLRDMIFLSNTSLQKWQLYHQRPEKFIHEQDIYERIRDHIFSDQNTNVHHPDDLHIRLLDVQYTADDAVAVLVSYRQSASSSSSSSSSSTARSFCIAMFDTQHQLDNEELFLIDRIDLNYTAYDDPRPNTRPQLLLSSGNKTAAYVIFPEALVIVSLLPGSNFQEAIFLKHAQQDRILGAGCQREWRRNERNGANQHYSTSQIVLACASTGLLLVQVDTSKIQKEAQFATSRLNNSLVMPDEQALETLQLKSRIEQAVFFGAFNRNPLSFVLSDKVKGNLDMAVLDVSEDILTSASKYVNTSLDMRQQLAERLECMTSIIHFINSSGLQAKLELLTRYKLCWAAEKLASAIDLWHYYNQQLSRSTSSTKSSSQPIILEAIVTLGRDMNIMTKSIQEHTDPVRPFFRYHLAHLDRFLEYVQRQQQQQMTKMHQKLSAHSTDYYQCVIQVSKIIELVIQASYTYRKGMVSIYGLKTTASTTSLPSWTETEDRIALLQTQCEAIIESLNGIGHDTVNSIHINDTIEGDIEDTALTTNLADTPSSIASTLLYQLYRLSDMLFRTFTDRLTWLSSGNISYGQDKEGLETRYKELQLRIIKPLVKFGQVDRAIRIAEQYRNFNLLIKLIFNHIDQEQVIKKQIPQYLSLYGDEFGFALFAFYIQTHNCRLLLDMPDQYNSMLKRYLDQHQYDDLAWIHDLRLRLFNDASRKLIQSTEQATSVHWQKTMLSMGKLAYMASLTTDQLDEQKVQLEIAKFDEQLDRVEMQERLEAACLAIVTEHVKQSTTTEPLKLSNKIAIIREQQANPQLCTHHFSKWMEQWIGCLLEGTPLDIDDFVEYISLKQANTDYELEDFGRALTILACNANQLTETRSNAALRTLWRRILLKDDWSQMQQYMGQWSDEELRDRLSETALYHVFQFAQNSGAFDEGTLSITFLLPHEMYWSTSKIDMELRFTGASNDQINQLMIDYQNENKKLDELIHSETFIRFYQEIARLNDIQLPDQSIIQETYINAEEEETDKEEEEDMNDVTAIYLTEEREEEEDTTLSSDILPLVQPSSPNATHILLSDDNDDNDDSMLLDEDEDAGDEEDDVIRIQRSSSNMISDTDEMQLASIDPSSDDHNDHAILLTDDQTDEMQTDH